jgi:hypothetical protein
LERRQNLEEMALQGHDEFRGNEATLYQIANKAITRMGRGLGVKITPKPQNQTIKESRARPINIFG